MTTEIEIALDIVAEQAATAARTVYRRAWEAGRESVTLDAVRDLDVTIARMQSNLDGLSATNVKLAAERDSLTIQRDAAEAVAKERGEAAGRRVFEVLTSDEAKQITTERDALRAERNDLAGKLWALGVVAKAGDERQQAAEAREFALGVQVAAQAERLKLATSLLRAIDDGDQEKTAQCLAAWDAVPGNVAPVAVVDPMASIIAATAATEAIEAPWQPCPFERGQAVEWRDGVGGVWPATVSAVDGGSVKTSTRDHGNRRFYNEGGRGWACGGMTLHPRKVDTAG